MSKTQSIFFSIQTVILTLSNHIVTELDTAQQLVVPSLDQMALIVANDRPLINDTGKDLDIHAVLNAILQDYQPNVENHCFYITEHVQM